MDATLPDAPFVVSKVNFPGVVDLIFPVSGTDHFVVTWSDPGRGNVLSLLSTADDPAAPEVIDEWVASSSTSTPLGHMGCSSYVCLVPSAQYSFDAVPLVTSP